MTFYRSSDGRFYQASGLKGGGLIRHIDKPYSELREGDAGYDEELLDITDDSPYWKIYWPPCQKIYTLHQKKMYKVFIRNTRVGMQQQGDRSCIMPRYNRSAG